MTARPRDGEPTPPARGARWVLLIHQLPPSPPYFRVKIWRRLQALGAVPIKNSVYALPLSEQAVEDFQWVHREILEGGGEASVCEARLLHGITDGQVEALFIAARDADYNALADDIRGALKRVSKRCSDKLRAEVEGGLAGFRRRFGAISQIDHFHTSGRERVHALLAELEERLARAAPEPLAKDAAPAGEKYHGRTWVTRRGIHVDRMASAWLIRRFIDPEARFKFVVGKDYRPEPGELRFDMYEAEYTHVGERCTFEVLLERMAPADPALRPIAEIIHDIDIKDGKYGREQTSGVESLVAGIALSSDDDEQRLARGSALFDQLYEFFRRKRS